MKQTFLKGKTLAAIALSFLTINSCSDIDEYYESPSWMGGSIYATLQDDGNYSVFLSCVDKADYTTIMDGKSILTVMAPDDEAMNSYLQQTYGTTDIEDIDVDELKKLIGNHILYYSFDKSKLINFRPNEGDGATEDEKNENAGMFFRFRTHSQDATTQEWDATRQRYVTVYHNERMLPVFSYRMFETKGVDAQSNYDYFYPETGWRDDAGFNVANAAVDEYEVIGRNGYIYKIDRVLKPMQTIYKELQDAGKYTRILSLYDKSEVYSYDSIQTRESSSSDSLFHHYHNNLPNIDSEWGDITDYKSISALASQAYSLFAPTDEAFQNFFDEYWGAGGYTSLEEIDSVTMQEIMRNCVYSTTIAFPDEVVNGKIENISGEIIELDPTQVAQDDRVMCSNGVLYGCSVLTPPQKFRAVTGPSYQYLKYTNFGQMLNNSGMASTLVQDAVTFIMLYPDNDQLLRNAGIKRGDTGALVGSDDQAIGTSTQTAYILAHSAQPTDGNTILPTSGKKVIPTLTTDFKMYWYIKDGKITNSIMHNDRLKYAANTVTDDKIWADFHELTYCGDFNGWTNGHTYSYDSLLFTPNYSSVNNSRLVRLMINNRNDDTTEFFGWINLLNKAGFTSNSGGTITFMTDDCFMLIPKTSVVEQAIKNGVFPGVTAGDSAVIGDATFFDYIEIDASRSEELQDYLELYFVPLTTAPFTNYPYIGWGEDTSLYDGLPTLQQETVGTAIITTNMNVYDDGTALSVAIKDRDTGADGKRVMISGDYDYFPFVFEDGPAHFIEDTF